METTKMESLRCNAEQVNERIFKAILQDVKFVPTLYANLFSINTALKYEI
jgi:hypothetical protein